VIDFVNLKIKSTQFFKGAYKGNVSVYIWVIVRMCMSIYIYTVFLKKHCLQSNKVLNRDSNLGMGI
jgi:hypothetical protein